MAILKERDEEKANYAKDSHRYINPEIILEQYEALSPLAMMLLW